MAPGPNRTENGQHITEQKFPILEPIATASWRRLVQQRKFLDATQRLIAQIRSSPPYNNFSENMN